MAAGSIKGRVVGAAIAAALISGGVFLAVRPVGDQLARVRDTVPVEGFVVSARYLSDGDQLVTVTWPYSVVDPLPHAPNSQLEINGGWDYSAGDEIDLAYNPAHPDCCAIPAYPSETDNQDFRADAILQSFVPFTIAAIVLALFVIWPMGQAWSGRRGAMRSARRSVHWYLLTPCVACCAAVVLPVAAQHYLRGLVVPALLSELLLGLIAWPLVRVVRYHRLSRLLTVVDRPADREAVVRSVNGRKLRIGGSSGFDWSTDSELRDIKVTALRLQPGMVFTAGDRVQLFGRWETRGPVLLMPAYNDRDIALIGLGRRRRATTKAEISNARSW